jgi:hypothetical protein
MDVDKAIQESVPWTEVKRKNNNAISSETTKDEIEPNKSDDQELTMKKVKVTFAVRVPKDMKDFSPAKLHIEALHEIHKFDESMIVYVEVVPLILNWVPHHAVGLSWSNAWHM